MAASADAGGSLSWWVRLPQRKARMGERAPVAMVLLGEEGGPVSPEHIVVAVPVSVGKRLESGRKTGELSPSTATELTALVGQIEQAQASLRVEGLVNRRDYSAAELGERLRRDGYRDSAVRVAVERAVDCGLVSDRRFADVFVRSKAAAGWGRQRIERELARRGVSADVLSGWPEDYLPEEGEQERALEVARRRRLTGRNDYQKLVRFLLGRGFSMGVATTTARQVLQEAEADDE